MKVVLVDDEDLVRQGLMQWLQSLDNVDVIGEAADAESGKEVICKLKPDVALVDIVLPGLSGIDLVKQLQHSCPSVKSLILSSSTSPDLVLDAFGSGAVGYLPKDTSVAELRVALKAAMDSRWYLSPLLTRSVMERAQGMRKMLERDADESAEQVLTDKEREVLKLIAEGQTFAQIGDQLEVNARTVERTKRRIEEKLNAHSLIDLIRSAIKMGIVSP